MIGPAAAGGTVGNDDGSGADGAAHLVDPGWDIAAQEIDGTFLSLHEQDSTLQFRAVNSAGIVLWTAERPRVCSGFLLTSSKEGPVAILMDQQPSMTGTLRTTASGFDLAAGERLWGPVEVPGPLLGSGLVFAGPPQDFIGEGGPRTVLNPATGEIVAKEDSDSPRVITLLGSHLVLADGDELVGQDLDGNRLWTRNVEDLGVSVREIRDMPWEAIGDSHALLGSAGDSQRRLIDLRSGADVATGITDAGFDSKSSLLVTANSNLHGFDLDGRKQWDAPLAADDHLSAVGGGIIAIEDESSAKSTSGGTRGEITGEFEMRSVNDGRALNPVDANLGVPHHIAETGARLVGDPSKPLLVTPGH